MIPKLYIPTPILMPSEITKRKDVQALLLGYMEDYYSMPRRKVLRKGDVITFDKSVATPITHDEKMELLESQIPLFYDALLVKNKLLAIGPYLPNLGKMIGKPRLFLHHLQHKNKTQEVKYFQENYRELNYVVIDNIPEDVKINPADWQLSFKFESFEQRIRLQQNPFNGGQLKNTLVTAQKDNPLKWISDWCNYYHENHEVGRVIIYNNAPTPLESLPDLSVNDDMEVWYVEWPHKKYQRFCRCQFGSLNHSYRLAQDVTSYFLNFDIDEYLVNDSGMPLDAYLSTKNPKGIAATCFNVPINIPRPDKDYRALKNSVGTRVDSTTKYMYAPNFWHFIDVHRAYRTQNLLGPSWLILLNTSRKNIIFLIMQYFNRVSFKAEQKFRFHQDTQAVVEATSALNNSRKSIVFSIMRKLLRKLIKYLYLRIWRRFIHKYATIGVAPADELYFLHYGSLNHYSKVIVDLKHA
ncbi:MAG: hypothetical protein K0U41_08150 [Gammaproteobacteria bacterium]|nr:hypothetical protein [Gammaproteobacteria bacterium]